MKTYKIRNGKFLSQDIKDKRKDNTVKLLNKFKHPPPIEYILFFLMKNCKNQMVNSLTLTPLLGNDNDENQTPSPNHSV